MLAGVQPEQICLGSVRCRGSSDALRERGRVERAMARLDIASLGLSRHALLITRHVAPRKSLGGEASASRFAEAVRFELLRKVREARRPWLHGNDASAAAVLFLDETELAACLVRDWLSNRVLDHWWWRFVLGPLSAAEWVRRRLLPRGEIFAAAIEVLARTPAAVAWIRRMDDSERSLAWIALRDAYGIETRSAAIDAPARGVTGPLTLDASEMQARAGSVAALEVLLRAAPEAASCELHAEARALLASALVVRRQLPWARTQEFAQSLAACRGVEWLARTARLPSSGDAETATKSVPHSMPGHVHSAATMPMSLAAHDSPQPQAIAPGEADSKRVAIQPQPPRMRHTVTQPDQDASTPTSPEAERTAHIDLPCPSTTGQRETPLPNEPVHVDSSTTSERESTQATQGVSAVRPPHLTESESPEAAIATRFGGIFYLLNVALAMGLYGDFTAPRHRGLELSPWDWLAAVGRHWFGRKFRKDPIWKVLADLAGRPPRRRPETGFKIADMSEQVITRLMRALGTDDPSQVPAHVCRHRAHIYKSASELDVHLSLDELPIELRAAGLDRDPGWIPAAGYSVRFHFE